MRVSFVEVGEKRSSALVGRGFRKPAPDPHWSRCQIGPRGPWRFCGPVSPRPQRKPPGACLLLATWSSGRRFPGRFHPPWRALGEPQRWDPSGSVGGSLRGIGQGSGIAGGATIPSVPLVEHGARGLRTRASSPSGRLGDPVPPLKGLIRREAAIVHRGCSGGSRSFPPGAGRRTEGGAAKSRRGSAEPFGGSPAIRGRSPQCLVFKPQTESGRKDSNLRLPGPKPGALTRLSYAPSHGLCGNHGKSTRNRPETSLGPVSWLSLPRHPTFRTASGFWASTPWTWRRRASR